MRIGIDLGGTNIAAGLVDEQMNILCKMSLPTQSERPYQAIVEDMVTLVKGLVNMGNISLSDVRQVGIGCPGTPKKETGDILFSNNLHWHNVPLLAALAEKLPSGIHWKLDNDANCAALGEVLAGAARGSRYAIMITLGTGVGGGIVLDGQIYDGVNHAGAEIGHMVIVSDGELCTCGRKGCLESYASATALIRMACEAAREHPESMLASQETLNGLVIFQAAEAGDSAAKAVIQQYLFYVAEGITNVVNIFQPEVIVIGGGICAQGEKILQPIRAQVAQAVFCKQVSVPKMVTATLGNDAGIIGAAFL